MTEQLIRSISKDLESGFEKMVISGGKTRIKKIVIRPIEIKGEKFYQVGKYQDNQVFHENIQENSMNFYVYNVDFAIFKQVQIYCRDKTISYLYNGKHFKRIVNASSNVTSNLEHDKVKQRIFEEGEDIPALRDLGVFTSENKVVKSMYDKYRQINRFVEIVADELKNYEKDSITILDFGCGKSYLTFLLHYYLSKKRGLKVTIKGYDLKADVVEHCNALAEKYGYKDLYFVCGDVAKEKIDFHVDMMITLHACDTATDYALFAAIKNDIKYIFSVPCCQHEINNQIRCDDEFSLLLKHGLIKERFSALLTDSVRCEILRSMGYKVDVLEFVDFEHSPKNLMIRATKTGYKQDTKNIEKILERFNASQTLYSLINKQ